MRAIMAVLLLSACGGLSENEVVWQSHLGTAGLTIAADQGARGDLSWLDAGAGDLDPEVRRTGTGTPDEEKDCPNGGRAALYSDVLCFEDCEIPDSGGQVWNGTITASDDEFSYDAFTMQWPDGTTGTINGGYFHSGDTTTVDMTLQGDDMMEYGGAYTTHVTGSFTATGGLLNGSFTMQTDHEFKEYAGDDQGTTCTFENIDISDWMRLMSDKAYKDLVVQRMCPQFWDEEISLKVKRRHLHSGDSDNIHILLPGEDFPEGRLIPGSVNSELIKVNVGEQISVRIGRGGTVWETTTCPPASTRHDLEAAYDDGFGLNSYEFYCIYEGDVRPSLE